MLHTLTTKSTRTDGRYSDAQLEMIDALLEEGATLPQVLEKIGTEAKPEPITTFYFRLKQSRKRINTTRRLVDV